MPPQAKVVNQVYCASQMEWIGLFQCCRRRMFQLYKFFPQLLKLE